MKGSSTLTVCLHSDRTHDTAPGQLDVCTSKPRKSVVACAWSYTMIDWHLAASPLKWEEYAFNVLQVRFFRTLAESFIANELCRPQKMLLC